MIKALAGTVVQMRQIERDTSSPGEPMTDAPRTVAAQSSESSSASLPSWKPSKGSDQMHHPRRWRWPLPVLSSLALHMAVVGITLIHWPFGHPDEAPPPAAMVVELAVMPAAPPVPQTEIPPGPKQVEAAPKPIPHNAMKFDPPPQVDNALKPDFALPVKNETKPTDAKVEAKDAHETTAPQAVQTPVIDKAAAPVDGDNNAPPSDAEQDWGSKVTAKLARYKRYPASAQSAGQEDSVFVRLTFDRKGRLLNAAIKQSRGFEPLDDETLALARRASPYPPPPDSIEGDQITRLFEVDFFIKKRP